MSFNRLANTKNHFQTPAKRVLCVCSAGLLRSPTVANVLHQEYEFNTRAAGANNEYALIRVDNVLLEWADEIVCVEKEVADDLRYAHDLGTKRVIVLALPDKFPWNDPELRYLIKKQYDDVTIMEKAHVSDQNG